MRYIAFLRGINVSGHHKIPMAELRQEMEKLGYKDVATILNSGNVIFGADDTSDLEKTISEHLEKVFGFPVPTIIRSADLISTLLKTNPFKSEELTKETRFYISFLREATGSKLPIPWISDDGSYRILKNIEDNTILSVLDLSISGTTKAMDTLEKEFGKDITTRNWNTIKRLEEKL